MHRFDRLTRAGMRLLVVLTTTVLLAVSLPVHAVESGVTDPPQDGNGNALYPPDSPSKRVDPNVTSSPFAGVGYITAGGTGVVLDRYHVLTAAHVVYNINPSTTSISFNLTYTGTPDMPSFSDPVTAWQTAPNFTGFNASPNDSNDIAVLTLRDPLPNYVPAYQLYTAPLAQGTTLTFVGYGASGDGINGYTIGDDGVTKRVGQNNADELDTGDQGADVNEVFVYDFDGPNDANGTPQDPNYLGGTTLGNTVEGNIGNGDSGAPAFINVNGQYQVAGVMDFLAQFQNPDGSSGPALGLFGSGGGGAIVSAYTSPGGFLQPFAAPEPNAVAVFGLGSLLLIVGGFAKSRHRAGTSTTATGLPK